MTRPAALITGVGRAVGIGAGIARGLADDGWDLALSRWTPADEQIFGAGAAAGLDEVVADLEARGARVVVLPADLESVDAAASVISEAGAALGTLEALVLSHAWSVDSGLLDTSLEQFDRHFAVNTRASWQLIVEFARQAEHGGAIVALTSDHTSGNLPYGASKGALDRIVMAAAKELGPRGISANVLNPGPIDTGWMDDDLRVGLTGMQPSGRLGTPADTANLVAFLVSEKGRWVTGQLLKSDGGFSIDV
ncbi:3-oxoacyl-[acyl-carrier protein] reductase [Conyzicola lurida]|uniref:3-oxoacyl-[acyl-carrier protein] reductase n=1 Tax=Conyzicola lurida TaxID=1172621 RepID=A0A841ASZ7_9MICO|nr:SDR family oxidoreductase [Conyzicola lurida]MBB5845072.1 3-oxoacyl-[acyl-carrier protein] reductase [Conyzicola lurida]